MAKSENVRPAMTTSTFFLIADFLIQNGDNPEIVGIGRAMRQAYEAGLVEKNKVEYEETDNTGSPENYQNSMECKTGVCD